MATLTTISRMIVYRVALLALPVVCMALPVVCMALLIGASLVFAAQLPPNHELSYVYSDSHPPADHHIMLVDIQRGLQVRLYTEPVGISDLRWSPDGERLAYYAWFPGEHVLTIHDFGARTVHHIRENPTFASPPTWSPDSRYLALISNRDRGLFKLYELDTDTLRMTELPSDTITYDRSPSWAADGESVVFAAQAANVRDVAIHRYDFTDNNESIIATIPRSWYNIAPDGSQIASLVADSSGINMVFTQLMAQIDTVTIALNLDQDANHMLWSPDSTRVATISDSCQYSTCGLTVMDSRTEERIVVTDDIDVQFPPAWSPDSESLAFLRDIGTPSNMRLAIFVAPAQAESISQQVLNITFDNRMRLSWRPRP